jgi:hypothetical protein
VLPRGESQIVSRTTIKDRVDTVWNVAGRDYFFQRLRQSSMSSRHSDINSTGRQSQKHGRVYTRHLNTAAYLTPFRHIYSQDFSSFAFTLRIHSTEENQLEHPFVIALRLTEHSIEHLAAEQTRGHKNSRVCECDLTAEDSRGTAGQRSSHSGGLLAVFAWKHLHLFSGEALTTYPNVKRSAKQ